MNANNESFTGMDAAKKKDFTVNVTVSVKKKLWFYPIFYSLKLLIPILIWFLGVEKTYDICEKLLKNTIEVEMVS